MALLILTLSVAGEGVGADIAKNRARVNRGRAETLLKRGVRYGPMASRVTACRELGRMGYLPAVPTLSGFLARKGDQSLFDAACSALERIPGPEAEAALLKAAKGMDGSRLAALSQALGNRRSVKAIPLLERILGGKDETLRRSAAFALADIRTPETLRALVRRAGEDPCVAEASLLAVTRMGAMAELDSLLALKELPDPVRIAALRYKIRALPEEEGIERWKGAWESGNPWERKAAWGLLCAFPESDDFAQLLAEIFPTLKGEMRSRFCGAIALRGEFAVENIFLDVVSKGEKDPDFYLAAEALARLGSESGSGLLLNAYARSRLPFMGWRLLNTLSVYRGRTFDPELLFILGSPERKLKKVALILAGERGLKAAMDAVLRFAGDPDPGIRSAAGRALRKLAGLEQLPQLLTLIRRFPDETLFLSTLNDLCEASRRTEKGPFTIVRAEYGRIRTPEAKDVTERVRQLLEGGGASIPVSYKTFGNVMGSSYFRELLVVYRTDGDDRAAVAREGHDLILGERRVDRGVEARILEAYRLSFGTYRRALLKVIAKWRSEATLEVLSGAAGQGVDPVLREDAITYLAEWKSPAVLASLARLGESCGEGRLKPKIEQAFLALVQDGDTLTPDRKADLLSQALNWVHTPKNRELYSKSLEKERALAESLGLGFDPIFNGRDLVGWESLSGEWQVEEGVLVGRRTGKGRSDASCCCIRRNEKLGDCELFLDFRLGKGSRSSIRFRSVRGEGYEAVLEDNTRFTGTFRHTGHSLKGERGESVKIDAKGKKSVRRFSGSYSLGRAYREGEWNSCRILCRGREAALWLNGTKVCELRDERPEYLAAEGLLMLCLENGGEMKVEFRNIRIKKR